MISTKGRYAVRFMIDLAEQASDKPVPLDGTAERQNISKKYLESVVKLLVKGKLVKGASGKGGGYSLLRKPDEYTVWEILELTEGTMAPVACLAADADECPAMGVCKTVPMWRGFNDLTYNYFSNITIADIVSGKIAL